MSRPLLPLDRPCVKCGRSSPDVIFSIRKHGGRESWCRACKYAYLSAKKYRTKWKPTVILYYGEGEAKCSCPGCSVTEIEFLTIDHINGGGRQHRKEVNASGDNIYHWIIKNNYPENIRILCYNCNCSRGHLGYCPHERKPTPLVPN